MDSESQRFFDAGQSFRNAYGILEQGCDFPPSFECFCQALRDARRRSSQTTAEIVAQQIVDDYKRTNLFGY